MFECDQFSFVVQELEANLIGLVSYEQVMIGQTPWEEVGEEDCVFLLLQGDDEEEVCAFQSQEEEGEFFRSLVEDAVEDEDVAEDVLVYRFFLGFLAWGESIHWVPYLQQDEDWQDEDQLGED